MKKPIILDQAVLREIVKYEVREAISHDREQILKDIFTKIKQELPESVREKQLIQLVQDTIRRTLANCKREQVLQELMTKKYVTLAKAVLYLEDVGIGRAKLSRMIAVGTVRTKAKELEEPQKGPGRIYAEDIYKLLCD
jgi:hypothetical protein